MRLAEIEDWRRRLGRRHANAAPLVEAIDISDLPGFEDIAFKPETGFLAVCGGTGTGKTAVLQLMHAGLSPAVENERLLEGPRFAAAKVKIRTISQGVVFERTTSVGNLEAADLAGFEGGSRFISLAERTSKPADYFAKNDISVLQEGISPSDFPDKDLAAINAITRKDFSRVSIYEIEGENEEILPFFEVEEDGHIYDSRSLSTGELSALYIAWAITTAEPFSFIFIEEPESFLPAISHGPLFGMLSKAAVELRLGLVVSTHSPTIASNVERKNLVSIVRHRGQSKLLSSAESRVKALWRLGMKPSPHAILFVEDDLAKSILNEIKGLYEFDIVCNVEILDARGGAGGIKNALENMPEGITSVSILGVLDGDMEDEAKNWPCKDNLLFLPFRAAAEKEFLREAEDNPARFGKALARSEQAVRDALESSRGENYHDRFNSLPASLGHTSDAVRSAALRHWVKNASRKAHVKRFAERLARRLGVVLPSEA